MSAEIRRASWRDAASLVLMVVLAVAVLSVVLDGGRPAFAADDCQYGQYGPYAPYGPYGQPCPKAKPSLSLSGPSTTGVGGVAIPLARLENGAGPSSFIIFHLYRPGDESCSSPVFTGSATVNGNGTYSPGFSPFFPPILDQVGTWRWTATYQGDAQNEPAASPCGAYTVTATRRVSGIFINRPSPLPVGSVASISGGTMFFQPTGTVSLRVYRAGRSVLRRRARVQSAGQPLLLHRDDRSARRGRYLESPAQLSGRHQQRVGDDSLRRLLFVRGHEGGREPRPGRLRPDRSRSASPSPQELVSWGPHRPARSRSGSSHRPIPRARLPLTSRPSRSPGLTRSRRRSSRRASERGA